MKHTFRGLMLLAGLVMTTLPGNYSQATETTVVTTNTTTINETANNTNTNFNTNVSTVNNTNVNTNTTTATNTNNNNTVSSNTNYNVNTGTQTFNNNNISTVNSNNVNTNNTVVTNNSTINSTNLNNNVSVSTNTNNSVSTNTNINKSESLSNSVSTNLNKNENTTDSRVMSTNTNINRNENVTKVEQDIKAPPASAIAPMISTYSQDVCVSGISGAVQTQVFGVSAGKAVRDMNCERLKLSKTLYDMGMKIAAVSLMCQDERVFKAMEMAGTPCPYMGKIGKEAAEQWATDEVNRPTVKNKWWKFWTESEDLPVASNAS